MSYIFHIIIYLNIYIILALSLNLVVGYMGRLNLAHAVFFGIGAYTYALVTLKLDVGFIPAVAFAMILGAIFSLSLSLPSWRFKGDMFVIITLAVQFLVHGFIKNWSSTGTAVGTWSNLTNGPFGISGISRPVILGIQLDTISTILALTSVIMIASAYIFFRLTYSSWGRLLKCIRDDELALRGLGKGLRLAKVQVFAISCAMAALSGAIYSSYVTYIDPTSTSLDESILLLSMLCVGGIGNFRGPIAGAVVLILIPEVLRLTPLPSEYAPNVRMMAYGLLLIIIVHFRPQGILGEYRIE